MSKSWHFLVVALVFLVLYIAPLVTGGNHSGYLLACVWICLAANAILRRLEQIPA